LNNAEARGLRLTPGSQSFLNPALEQEAAASVALEKDTRDSEHVIRYRSRTHKVDTLDVVRLHICCTVTILETFLQMQFEKFPFDSVFSV